MRAATSTVPLVYDFWGFPDKYYTVRYPAPGAPELADDVRKLLRAAGTPVEDIPDRGLDHGAYVPLVEMYPDYVRARSGRGVMHARLGNEKQALADAEESLRREPSAAIVYQVAGIYALLDKTRSGSRAEALPSVSTMPGLTAFTRIFFGPNSALSVRVIESTAALVAE